MRQQRQQQRCRSGLPAGCRFLWGRMMTAEASCTACRLGIFACSCASSPDPGRVMSARSAMTVSYCCCPATSMLRATAVLGLGPFCSSLLRPACTTGTAWAGSQHQACSCTGSGQSVTSTPQQGGWECPTGPKPRRQAYGFEQGQGCLCLQWRTTRLQRRGNGHWGAQPLLLTGQS